MNREKILTYTRTLSPEKIYETIMRDGIIATSTHSLVSFVHFIEMRDITLKLSVTFEGKNCVMETTV